ncbi:MAG: VOC family protein [Desulfobacterales bacterium]
MRTPSGHRNCFPCRRRNGRPSPYPPGATAPCLFSAATEDCDGAYKKAIAAGAESLSEPTETFWGMRSALLKDPFGYRWALNQQIEAVSPKELEKRARAIFSS